ncbi:MAG: glycosyltransferase family 4 protein [Verrucomicrobiota bacterium]
MRVTLIIYSLGAGGAERVITTMANYWSAKGWNITLLTAQSLPGHPFYRLRDSVIRRNLDIARCSGNAIEAFKNNLRRIRVIRQAISESKADVVISLMSEINILTILATLWSGIPVIVQEQIDPHEHPLLPYWKVLRNLVYPYATFVVTLNDRSMAYFSPRIRKRGKIIPNPAVDHENHRRPRGEEIGPRTVIAMGRLVPQKGFDMLIAAFASVANKHDRWTLKIFGDGPLRKELESRIEDSGLLHKIRLEGLTKDPFKAFCAADLFVMSSRYEGFPLALCEAMSCGLPVISFDCASGPSEIIRHRIDGLLVPAGDVKALSSAMDDMMRNDREREVYASRAPEVVQRYGVEGIMDKWEHAIKEAIK